MEDPEKLEAPPETFPTIVPIYMRKVSGAALQCFGHFALHFGARSLVGTAHAAMHVATVHCCGVPCCGACISEASCQLLYLYFCLYTGNFTTARLWVARHAAGCARLQAFHQVLQPLHFAPSCDRPARGVLGARTWRATNGARVRNLGLCSGPLGGSQVLRNRYQRFAFH